MSRITPTKTNWGTTSEVGGGGGGGGEEKKLFFKGEKKSEGNGKQNHQELNLELSALKAHTSTTSPYVSRLFFFLDGKFDFFFPSPMLLLLPILIIPCYFDNPPKYPHKVFSQIHQVIFCNRQTPNLLSKPNSYLQLGITSSNVKF